MLELDYLNEASNQERFRRDFSSRMGGRVYIPKVYNDLTTRKVQIKFILRFLLFHTILLSFLGSRQCHKKCWVFFGQVLVSEWIEGEQLAKSPPDVIDRLTKVGVECFLAQLLETGFFHADPHPGNLLVTRDEKLALIDFGLCAEVPLPDTKVAI